MRSSAASAAVACLGAVVAWLRRGGGAGIIDGQTGTITVAQRLGGYLKCAFTWQRHRGLGVAHRALGKSRMPPM